MSIPCPFYGPLSPDVMTNGGALKAWQDRRKQRDRELDWLVDQAVQAGMPLDAALRERDLRVAEDLRQLLLARYNDLNLTYWR